MRPLSDAERTRFEEGLPIGVQVVGRQWADEQLLAAVERLVEVTDGFVRPPGY